MTPETRFDQRIAEIHGLGSSTATDMPAKPSKTDIRREEFRALVETFLGEDFDPRKVAAVEEAQLHLHREQENLATRWQAGKMPAAIYAASVNRLIDEAFQHCEKILGAKDFLRLFGGSPTEVGGHLDEAAFVEAHTPLPRSVKSARR